MKTNKKMIISLGLFVFILSIILKIGIIVKADSDNISTVVSNAQAPNITYISQVQNKGWLTNVSNGETSGTTGEALRLEGIKISLGTLPKGLSGNISYSANVQGSGWQKEVSDGALAGTTGKGLRLEGIRIRLVGEISKLYSVYYRTHVQGKGWTNYVKDNEISGAVGESLRVEAIQIKLCQKVTDQNVSTTQLTNEIDQSLTPTQRWINSISDEIGKQDWHILGGNQSVNDGLTLTSVKVLNDDYHVINKLTFKPNNNDITINSVIFKGENPQAAQIATGNIEKDHSKVILNFTDEKTGKEGKLDLTSGHSSAVAAIPISFAVLGGVTETGALSAAMAAAAPGVLIIGGATVLIGGGYWLYNQAKANQAYSSAADSRAQAASKEMEFDFSSLGEALEAKDNVRSSYYQEKVLAVQNIIQANTSALSTPLVPNIQINPISIGRVDLSNFNATMSEFTKTMTKFNSDMVNFRQQMNGFTDPKGSFSLSMNAVSNSMRQLHGDLKKWPTVSADPTFTDVSYDIKTKQLHLVGSMPTISTIEIYNDWKKTQSISTQANGKFDIKVPIASGIIAVDTIQKATKETVYGSLSPYVGPTGLPYFSVDKNGQVLLNDYAGRLSKNPHMTMKASAFPKIDNVSYDIKRQQLSISGSMPTSSTIDLYNGSDKIITQKTKPNGQFSINYNVKPSSTIKLDAVQNSTNKIKYVSYSCSTYAGWTMSPTFLKALFISSDGILSSVHKEFTSVKSGNVKSSENSSSPIISNVTYDIKLKEFHIIGKIEKLSDIKFYTNSELDGWHSEIIKTIRTSNDGHFDVRIPSENGIIEVGWQQISSKTTYYQEPVLFSKPAFKVAGNGQIVVNYAAKVCLKSSLPEEKTSKAPRISSIKFDKERKLLNIEGKIDGKSTINIYGSDDYFSAATKIKSVSTDVNGAFKISIAVTSTVITLESLNNSTGSNVYRPSVDKLSFKINKEGEILGRSGINSKSGTQVIEETTSAIPTFKSVTYNPQTKQLRVIGTMPSASTINLYTNSMFIQSNATKIKTLATTGDGSFDFSISVGNNVLYIQGIQNSTTFKRYDIPDVITVPQFRVSNNGKVVTDIVTSMNLKIPMLVDSMTANPKVTGISYDMMSKSLNFPITMPSKSTVEIIKNGVTISAQETNASGFIKVEVPVDEGLDNNINIKIREKDTDKKIFSLWDPQTLTFLYNSKGELLTDKNTNFCLDKELNLIPTRKVSSPPHFSNLTYNKEHNLVNVSGKLEAKGSLEIYLNKVKTKNVATNENGEFNFELPVSVNAGEVANLSIGGILEDSESTKYTSSLSSLDQPMFTIDSSKGLQICGESTPLVDIKKLITPIPRIEPFSVGDGIIIEG
ncbi:hypothetical protein GRR91_14015, partial [Lactococcus lactis subsp. lactis]|nr:hypothetical protein [Lactococcus lactis subsp. lactis]MBR8678194.1 hypothetical protein [Lactococcus lactis subsp. lactis]